MVYIDTLPFIIAAIFLSPPTIIITFAIFFTGYFLAIHKKKLNGIYFLITFIITFMCGVLLYSVGGFASVITLGVFLSWFVGVGIFYLGYLGGSSIRKNSKRLV